MLKKVLTAGNLAGPAVLVHADGLSASTKPQEGAPLPSGVPDRSNQSGNGLTGLMFWQERDLTEVCSQNLQVNENSDAEC